jgi:hypothetical protein
MTMKHNHVGIPTTSRFDGEIPLPHLKVTVSDHQNNPFGIQWQRHWDGSQCPDLSAGRAYANRSLSEEGLVVALSGPRLLIRERSRANRELCGNCASTGPGSSISGHRQSRRRQWEA